MAKNFRAENRWTRLRKSVRETRVLWLTAGFIVLAVLLVVILWKVPQLQVEKYVNAAKGDGKTMEAKDRFNIENEARKTLATILGAIVVLGGAYFTWRNIKVAQEGQITDRFTKAIEQLGAVDGSGKKKLEVRLGGIYALERIAGQSERDYWPIMEVLSTYVRENAPLKTQESTQENQASAAHPHPTADIQAILTVLGRRDRKYERKGQVLDLAHTDIRGANLYGANLREAGLWRANLSGANLSGANLIGANLSRANLSGAYLSEANLSGAYLSGANLWRANLSGANLSRANLTGANLSGADLRRADLSGAILVWAKFDGADLRGANLSTAEGLTQEQVDAAKGDSDTKLPDNLHMPESWKT